MMESPKKKPKRKFRLFRCFKPQFYDDAVSPRGKAKNVEPQQHTYNIVAPPEKKKPIVLPRFVSSTLAAAKNHKENASRRKNIEKENNYSFRRALMEALNHSPLAKRLNDKRKTNKDALMRESSTLNVLSNTNSSPSSLGFTSFSLSSNSTTSTTLSNSSMGTNASNSSISESYLPKSLPMKNKQNIGDSRNGYFGSNMALGFLLITSLLVLIMRGKVCAIVYTSIGFFVLKNLCVKAYQGEKYM